MAGEPPTRVTASGRPPGWRPPAGRGLTEASELDDGADAARGPQVVEGGVDVVEGTAVGDQALQVELAGAGQLDEPRDVTRRVARTEQAAGQRLPAHRHER